jgi:hypothetical protein
VGTYRSRLHDATFKVVAAELEAETDRQSFSKGGTESDYRIQVAAQRNSLSTA